MISTKISTHNSKPDILASASAVDLVGNQLCMCDPGFCQYSTSSSYNYLHCFKR